MYYSAKMEKIINKAVGIIPAAGKAERFGGILKECLPASDGISLINHAANKLRDICDFIIVITNKDKIQNHMQDLKNVVFIEQNNNLNLLGAVQTALQIKADRYYFTMPDTFTEKNIFSHISLAEDLTIGIFQTYKPERFGCLVDGIIVDKKINDAIPAIAWGALSWSRHACAGFCNQINFTNALNFIIKNYSYSMWNINNYYDMATIKDYMEFIKVLSDDGS